MSAMSKGTRPMSGTQTAHGAPAGPQHHEPVRHAVTLYQHSPDGIGTHHARGAFRLRHLDCSGTGAENLWQRGRRSC
jgi:hypothetical protein